MTKRKSKRRRWLERYPGVTIEWLDGRPGRHEGTPCTHFKRPFSKLTRVERDAVARAVYCAA